eukprot:Selendium_serpulae@DN5686_c0_g1_i10.p1
MEVSLFSASVIRIMTTVNQTEESKSSTSDLSDDSSDYSSDSSCGSDSPNQAKLRPSSQNINSNDGNGLSVPLGTQSKCLPDPLLCYTRDHLLAVRKKCLNIPCQLLKRTYTKSARQNSYRSMYSTRRTRDTLSSSPITNDQECLSQISPAVSYGGRHTQFINYETPIYPQSRRRMDGRDNAFHTPKSPYSQVHTYSSADFWGPRLPEAEHVQQSAHSLSPGRNRPPPITPLCGAQTHQPSSASPSGRNLAGSPQEPRIQYRKRQIGITKSEPVYQRYVVNVPKPSRREEHPWTPELKPQMSKRDFDDVIRDWKKQLRKFDESYTSSPDDANEELRKVSAFSLTKAVRPSCQSKPKQAVLDSVPDPRTIPSPLLA